MLVYVKNFEFGAAHTFIFGEIHDLFLLAFDTVAILIGERPFLGTFDDMVFGWNIWHLFIIALSILIFSIDPILVAWEVGNIHNGLTLIASLIIELGAWIWALA